MNLSDWAFCIFYYTIKFAPYLILALIPFRDTYRFSRPMVHSLIVLLILIDLSIHAWCNVTKLLFMGTLIGMILYSTFYLIIVKAPFEKILFTLFIILNYAAMVTTVCLTLLIQIMGKDYVNTVYNAIFMFIVLLFTFPIMWKYMNRKIRPLVTLKSPGTRKAWKTLWLVPIVFYGIYYYSFYSDWSNSKSFVDFSSKIGNAFFVVFLNLGSFLVYNVIQNFLQESDLNLQLQLEIQQLSLLARHTENLQNKIEEAKKARHDLRHHLSMIDCFLQKNDISGLTSYLSQYRASLPDSWGLPICENKIVNAIAEYYSDLAKKASIDFSISLEIPKTLPILDSDFCGLFSNILENALEACHRMSEGKRFIHVSLAIKNNHTLLIMAENSYSGEIRRQGKYFLSAKKNRTGIGLKSVTSLVEKYNGMINYEYENNIFCIKILLTSHPSLPKKS